MQVDGIDQNLPIDATDILATLKEDLVQVGDLAPDGTDLTTFADEAPQAAGTGNAQPQPTGAPAPASQTPAAPAPAAATTTAAPAPTPAQAEEGEERTATELRRALRAARRAEERAVAELDRLRAAQTSAPAPVAPAAASSQAVEYTDAELAELEIENPTMARLLRDQQEMRRRLDEVTRSGAPAAPAPAAESDFVPARQDPAAQEAIDSIPQLLSWQLNPDQTAFIAAAHADSMLRALPAWKDRPLAERLAEATRLAAQQLGTPYQAPATSALPDPNSIPVRPRTGGISDFGGGAPGNSIQPDYEKMTVEQILASIPESS